MGAGDRGRIGEARGRVALAFVLLLALVFRAAIPAGWMPNLQGPAGAPLVICTGSGPKVLHLDRSSHPADRHAADHHDVCAFAGIGGAPASPALVLAEAPRLAFLARLDPAAEAALRPPARHREQAARAPPNLI